MSINTIGHKFCANDMDIIIIHRNVNHSVASVHTQLCIIYTYISVYRRTRRCPPGVWRWYECANTRYNHTIQVFGSVCDFADAVGPPVLEMNNKRWHIRIRIETVNSPWPSTLLFVVIIAAMNHWAKWTLHSPQCSASPALTRAPLVGHRILGRKEEFMTHQRQLRRK